MITVLEVGMEIPKDKNYNNGVRARHFWNLSYQGGINYVKGVDANNRPILQAHRREEAAFTDNSNDQKDLNFQERVRRAVPVNHLKPTIDKYIAYVFKNDVTRSQAPDAYVEFLDNFDGNGSPVDKVIKNGLKEALVFGTSYFLCQSVNRSSAPIVTLQQAKLYLDFNVKCICPDNVIWQDMEAGILTQAIIDMGDNHYLFVDDTYFIEFTGTNASSGETATVADIISQEVHGFSQNPLIAFTVDTLTSNLAEQQKEIFNFSSLLNEEMFNCTFSQQYFMGVDSSAIKEDKTIKVGNDRILLLPGMPGSSQSAGVLGADPAQADSLRKSIDNATANFYRVAGMPSPDPLQAKAPESGASKRLGMAELEGRLSGFAQECERVENLITNFWSEATGNEVETEASYPSEYSIADEGEEIDRLSKLLALPVPNQTKRKTIIDFEAGNLTADEMETLKQSLLIMYPDEVSAKGIQAKTRTDVNYADESSSKQAAQNTIDNPNAQQIAANSSANIVS